MECRITLREAVSYNVVDDDRLSARIGQDEISISKIERRQSERGETLRDLLCCRLGVM